MAVTNINGVTINKITKSQYDAEVLAGNITSAMEQNEVWIFTDDQHVSSTEKENWNAKSNFSGNYDDLTNKPTIPTVPTNVSEFTNDAGYLKSYTESDPTVPSHVKNITSTDISNWNAKSEFSGSYNDLTNKPTIPSVEGLASENYVDTKIANLVNSAPTTLDTLGEIATAIEENEDVVTALNSAIGNKANASDLAAVATSGSYNDLKNKPELFSGSYNDLTDKPTVPTAVTKIWE